MSLLLGFTALPLESLNHLLVLLFTTAPPGASPCDRTTCGLLTQAPRPSPHSSSVPPGHQAKGVYSFQTYCSLSSLHAESPLFIDTISKLRCRKVKDLDQGTMACKFQRLDKELVLFPKPQSFCNATCWLGIMTWKVVDSLPFSAACVPAASTSQTTKPITETPLEAVGSWRQVRKPCPGRWSEEG